ncbi:MAG: SLC13 family permease [Burkholderiaceae bacterium]
MSIWIAFISVFALVAYASNRFSLQSVSLSLIAALAILYAVHPNPGTLSVSNAFSGFASEALITIVALMVLGKSLIVTGALQPVANLLGDALSRTPQLAFLAVLVGGFALSGFLNDTPVVVMLLPILLGAAASAGRSAGSMLMPMNYAVILGGMMTAIGTSTNLLVNGLSADNGGPSFKFFDFYLVALPAAALGLVYLMFIAPLLLRNSNQKEDGPAEEVFLSSVRLNQDNKFVGQTVSSLRTALGQQVQLKHLVRGGREVMRFPTARLDRGDMLVLSGVATDLTRVIDSNGFASAASAQTDKTNASGDDGKLLRRQCVVTAGSPLVGRTVRESGLETRFNVRVAGLSEAISGDHTRTSGDVKFVPIQAGDSLLIEGTEDTIAKACEMQAMIAVGPALRRRVTRDATLALLIFAIVILTAISKALPISVAAVLGVLACVMTNVLKWEEIEQSVEWRIVLIVASSIALGAALVQSGAMTVIAQSVTTVAGDWPLQATIALVITISGLLTNFVSNNAAAAIMTPLALEVGRLLDAPLEPFVLAVLFGANMCFLTPMAYQTNLLVMAAGGYRFTDFTKVGLPLFLLLIPALTASMSWWYL